MVLKLDLSKTYDRVTWLYLKLMIFHVGFNLHVFTWIMGCITSISFSILMNGLTSNFFKPSLILRQGCPLSPLLFLLVIEGLTRAI
jgi:hypothetical protein